MERRGRTSNREVTRTARVPSSFAIMLICILEDEDWRRFLSSFGIASGQPGPTRSDNWSLLCSTAPAADVASETQILF